MTAGQIKNLACGYDAKIEINTSLPPLKMDAPHDVGSLRHLRWMFAQMEQMDDVGKLNRWLGFAQGVLWQLGVFTIDELRAHVTAAGAGK